MTRDFAAKSRHETIFNFHMNNFGAIIGNKDDFCIVKNKIITFKNGTTVKDQKIFKILKCRVVPILKHVEYDDEVYFFKKKMESSEI